MKVFDLLKFKSIYMLLPIILFVLLVIFAIYAFSTLKSKAVQKFPKEWDKALLNRVQFYKNLSEEKRKVFKKRMMAFLSEINIEGVKTQVTEEDRMLIAASAVIPVFGFGDWRYNNLSSILIYPDNFTEDLEFTG
ncbi:hypothetical protein ULMS_24050 [Patiriisocius marinistellae]|uniref:Uncharacterized protein n=1 Tax=Patiriisocius marinistellae TaxID=2494560 RepID=A0A5J4FW00_9FLAO|nr:hypothetical protein ULMS_24050 [Patiriisocius marinistellae]